MFGSKLRSWMENHIGRPRKKGNKAHKARAVSAERGGDKKQPSTAASGFTLYHGNGVTGSVTAAASASSSSSALGGGGGGSSSISSPVRRREVSPIQSHTQSRYGWQSPDHDSVTSPKSDNFLYAPQHHRVRSQSNHPQQGSGSVTHLQQQHQQQNQQQQQSKTTTIENGSVARQGAVGELSSSSISSLSWSTGSKEHSRVLSPPSTSAGSGGGANAGRPILHIAATEEEESAVTTHFEEIHSILRHRDYHAAGQNSSSWQAGADFERPKSEQLGGGGYIPLSGMLHEDDPTRYGRLLPSRITHATTHGASFGGSAESLPRAINAHQQQQQQQQQHQHFHNQTDNVGNNNKYYSQGQQGTQRVGVRFRNGGTTPTSVKSSTLGQQQHQHQHQHHHLHHPHHHHNSLSSPESAYSTGYSTDGTSPGVAGPYAPPPEYYATGSKNNNNNGSALAGGSHTVSHFPPKSGGVGTGLALEAHRYKFSLNMIEEMSPIEPMPQTTFGGTDLQAPLPYTSTAGTAPMSPLPGLRNTIILPTLKGFESPSPRQRCRIRTNPWYSTAAEASAAIGSNGTNTQQAGGGLGQTQTMLSSTASSTTLSSLSAVPQAVDFDAISSSTCSSWSVTGGASGGGYFGVEETTALATPPLTTTAATQDVKMRTSQGRAGAYVTTSSTTARDASPTAALPQQQQQQQRCEDDDSSSSLTEVENMKRTCSPSTVRRRPPHRSHHQQQQHLQQPQQKQVQQQQQQKQVQQQQQKQAQQQQQQPQQKQSRIKESLSSGIAGTPLLYPSLAHVPSTSPTSAAPGGIITDIGGVSGLTEAAPSDDDATLNEMMGKFDESYVYEKETDILSSDSDPTDCPDGTDLDTGLDAGDECDTDELLDIDFIDTASMQEAVGGGGLERRDSLRNYGSCHYYETGGNHNDSGSRHGSRQGSRHGSPVMDSVASNVPRGSVRSRRRTTSGSTGAAANVSGTGGTGGGGGSGGSQRRRKRFLKTRKKSSENRDIHDSGISPAPVRRGRARESRSVGGTPVCARRHVNHHGLPLATTKISETKGQQFYRTSPLTQRSSSLVFTTPKRVEGERRRLAIAESERALLRADLEADVKYRQLILEAESILVSMRSSMQSIPRDTPVASPRRLNPLANKRVEMLRYGEPAKQPIPPPAAASQQLAEQELAAAIHRRIELLKQETHAAATHQNVTQLLSSSSAPNSPKMCRLSPRRTHLTNFINQNAPPEVPPRKHPPTPQSQSSILPQQQAQPQMQLNGRCLPRHGGATTSSPSPSPAVASSPLQQRRHLRGQSPPTPHRRPPPPKGFRPIASTTTTTNYSDSDESLSVSVSVSIGPRRITPLGSLQQLNEHGDGRMTVGTSSPQPSLPPQPHSSVGRTHKRVSSLMLVTPPRPPLPVLGNHVEIGNGSGVYCPQSEPLRRKVYRSSAAEAYQQRLQAHSFELESEAPKQALLAKIESLRRVRSKLSMAKGKSFSQDLNHHWDNDLLANGNTTNANGSNNNNNNNNSNNNNNNNNNGGNKKQLILSTIADLKRNLEEQSVELIGLNEN